MPLALAQAADAVLIGAVGGPNYDTLPRRCGPSRGSCAFARRSSLFANLRPALLYPELAAASTLKPDIVAGLDLMIVRELTGDIYFGAPRGRRKNAADDDEGFDTMHYSAPEVARIARVGFETARKRGKKLCSVDKANVLDTSILWRESSARRRRNIRMSRTHMYVDNAAMQLVRSPKQFDDRDRQSLWRHPVGRGIDACRFIDAAICLASCVRQGTLQRSTARRLTSPDWTKRIRWQRSCRSQ